MSTMANVSASDNRRALGASAAAEFPTQRKRIFAYVCALLVALLLAAPVLLSPTKAYANIVDPQPFGLDLTWEITDDGELIIQPKLNADGTSRYKGRVATTKAANNTTPTYANYASEWPWHDYRDQITKVTANTKTADGKPAIETYNNARYSYMFANMPNLKEVDVSGLLSTRVQDARGMFQNCTSLEELDLSTWINNGTMQYMQDFANGCTNLRKFTLNNKDFHTKVVNTATNADDYKTYKLYEGIQNKEVTYSVGTGSSGAQTQRMFDGCTSLEELDLSNITISTWKDPQGNPNPSSTLTPD